MIGKSKIIVRTHVEHALAARDRNVRILRTRDDTLGFEKTLRLNFFQSLGHLILKFGHHRWTINKMTKPRKQGLTPRAFESLIRGEARMSDDEAGLG